MSDPSWTDYTTAIGTAVGAVATAVTAGIAWYAAATWRKTLSHASQHDVAREVLEAARLFRYLFYDARNPLYTPPELPADYYTVSGDARSPTQEARGWAHVYEGRWKLLEPQLLELARLRARAGAVLGDEVADAIESLAKKGRELHGFFQDRVEQIRSGEAIVSQWADQDWVKRVNEALTADPDRRTRDDRYSREFEDKFRALEALVSRLI